MNEWFPYFFLFLEFWIRILNQNRGDTFVNLLNKTRWNQWCLLFCAGENMPNQTEWGLWHWKCDMSQSTHFWGVLQQVNRILDTQSGNFKKHTIWANIAAELVVCNMNLPLEPKWQKQKNKNKQTCLFDAFGTLSRSNSIDRWSESDQALTSTAFVLLFFFFKLRQLVNNITAGFTDTSCCDWSRSNAKMSPAGVSVGI